MDYIEEDIQFIEVTDESPVFKKCENLVKEWNKFSHGISINGHIEDVDEATFSEKY